MRRAPGVAGGGQQSSWAGPGSAGGPAAGAPPSAPPPAGGGMPLPPRLQAQVDAGTLDPNAAFQRAFTNRAGFRDRAMQAVGQGPGAGASPGMTISGPPETMDQFNGPPRSDGGWSPGYTKAPGSLTDFLQGPPMELTDRLRGVSSSPDVGAAPGTSAGSATPGGSSTKPWVNPPLQNEGATPIGKGPGAGATPMAKPKPVNSNPFGQAGQDTQGRPLPGKGPQAVTKPVRRPIPGSQGNRVRKPLPNVQY